MKLPHYQSNRQDHLQNSSSCTFYSNVTRKMIENQFLFVTGLFQLVKFRRGRQCDYWVGTTLSMGGIENISTIASVINSMTIERCFCYVRISLRRSDKMAKLN